MCVFIVVILSKDIFDKLDMDVVTLHDYFSFVLGGMLFKVINF